MEVTLENIYWEWTSDMKFKSSFFANVREFVPCGPSDGTTYEAHEVFEILENEADAFELGEKYLWLSKPDKENIFYQTEHLMLTGSYSGNKNGMPEPKVGQIPKLVCPEARAFVPPKPGPFDSCYGPPPDPNP